MTLEQLLNARIEKVEKSMVTREDSADFYADACVRQELRTIRQLYLDGVIDDIKPW